jgi:Na+/H+ antiporter NhaD/arsenite permease-like protein
MRCSVFPPDEHGLAVFYTLAGDLLLVGSLANLIAIERAAEACVVVSFRHARAGIPITLPQWR